MDAIGLFLKGCAADLGAADKRNTDDEKCLKSKSQILFNKRESFDCCKISWWILSDFKIALI